MTLTVALGSLLLAAASAGLTSADKTFTVTPPPGWTASETESRSVFFRLTGPLRESAVLSRLTLTQYLYNRQAVSLSLERQLRGVAAETGVRVSLDPKLRHQSLANGAELDYRVAVSAGRPALLMALCRFEGEALLVQIVSHRAEERLTEIVGSLQRAGPGPAPEPPLRGAARRPGPSVPLIGVWVAALAVLAAAIAYHWRQLRRPSR